MLWEGARVGRWLIDRKVGENARSRCYRAHDPRTDTVVLIKVPNGASPAEVARYQMELRCQQRIRHPNVVGVYGEVEIDGVRSLLLQHVEGPSLATLIASGSLTPVQVHGLAEALLAGVGAIHAARVVHRDLRPANILVAPDGDRLIPAIAEFGQACLLDDPAAGRTLPREPGLTGYLAPEQVRDPGRVSVEGDVYALGLTLYELVCGVPPFPHADPRSIEDMVAERYLLPSQLGEIEAHIEAAIIGALHADPARRFPDVDTLWRAWHGEAPRSTSLRQDHLARLSTPARTGFLGQQSVGPVAGNEPLPPPDAGASEFETRLLDAAGSSAMWSIAVPAAVLVLAALGAAILRTAAPEPPPHAAPDPAEVTAGTNLPR